MRLNSYTKRILAILILNLIITSCNFAKKNKEKEEVLVSTYSNPKVFFKIFNISLAKGRNLELLLYRNSNSNKENNLITCSINDDGEKISEVFYGEINEEGIFNINSNENEELIILKGKFLSDSSIIIDYLDSKRHRFLKIKINETKTYYSIFPIHYENSKTVINKTCDSITNMVEVDMFSIKSNNINLNKKINQTIEKSIYKENIYYNIEDYIDKVNLSYDSYIDDLNVLEINNEILTLVNFNGYKICGAAHGEYNSSYLNVNLKSGEKINIEDILLTNSKNKLLGILQQKLKDENQEFLLGKNEKLYLENNFALLKRGILFSYGQYDLESFPQGTELLIPYSEVYGIINTESEIYKKLIKN